MDAFVTSIGPGDALLVIDVQNDFLPGGSLAVGDGDAVIAPLNRVLALFAQRRLPVFAIRDWHPPDHCSFTTQGGPWPVHCVAGTKGAGSPAALHLPTSTTVVSKAVAAERDAYSGFERTELAELLRMQGCAPAVRRRPGDRLLCARNGSGCMRGRLRRRRAHRRGPRRRAPRR